MSVPKVAIYNRFWHSQGGGERHSGMIAQVLSEDGAAVDLLGHTAFDMGELADHLGLDLSRCSIRIVPDRGYGALAELTADYDLVVNGSYMNRLAPRSRRAAYLCYFPTPFDHDMAPWRKAMTRTLGPLVRAVGENLDYGIGWFPPEGGRRRQWIWSSGGGVMTLPSGSSRRLRVDLGRPGASGPTDLVIADHEGRILTTVSVSPEFKTYHLDLGTTGSAGQVHFRSGTFSPGGGDVRTLGVAVSRPRLEGADFGVRERLAGRFPWLLRDPKDLAFLDSYQTVMANSVYTQGWIERLWGRPSDLLFPPIQVDRLHPAATRERAIVTVGRFFAPGLGHAKRQLEMVQFFGEIVRSGALEGWTLHVVGGCEPSQEPYLVQVRAAAEGLPVEVHPNADRSTVERLLSTSSIFWSATGFGEDERRKPWTSEHFGMTTVEAMAGGCVPVVIDRAGQKEIVREGIDGFRWSDQHQLANATIRVAEDESLRALLAASSIERAQGFSEKAFAEQLRGIVARHNLLG